MSEEDDASDPKILGLLLEEIQQIRQGQDALRQQVASQGQQIVALQEKDSDAKDYQMEKLLDSLQYVHLQRTVTYVLARSGSAVIYLLWLFVTVDLHNTLHSYNTHLLTVKDTCDD